MPPDGELQRAVTDGPRVAKPEKAEARAAERRERVALCCSLIALVVVCAALAPRLAYAGWKPSVFVHLGEGQMIDSLARTATPDFVIVSTYATYDGVVYYALARDPIGLGAAHHLVNFAAYRYDHPLYSWAVFLVSLGYAPWMPSAMFWLNLGLFALTAYIVSLLAVQLGRSPWWGLLPALSPGLLTALFFDTTEVTLAAAAALGVLLWLQRHRAAVPALVACCLAKELGWAVPVGLGLFEVARFLREERLPAGEMAARRLDRLIAAARSAGLGRRLALLAAGPILASAWIAYVEIVVGTAGDPLPRPAQRLAPVLVRALLRLIPAGGAWLLPLAAAAGGLLLRRVRSRGLRLGLWLAIATAGLAALLLVLLPPAPEQARGPLQPAWAAGVAAREALAHAPARFGIAGYNFFPLSDVWVSLREEASRGLRPLTALPEADRGPNLLLSMGMLPVTLAIAAAFSFGLLRALRLRAPVQGILLLMALPMLGLPTNTLEYPENLLRTTAVPLVFLGLSLIAPEGAGEMEEPPTSAV